VTAAPTLAVATDEAPVDPRLEDFRRQAFLAALTGIMASPKDWVLSEGRKADDLSSRVELAWRTADIALAKSRLWGK
jgi:hypothetical protein